jgi:hypothetical protein
MPDLAANMVELVRGFQIQGRMMRYNLFVPRIYNWCKSLGFEPGKIMPSRAFCSDESQGYPVIMIGKHFGIFPFNHGRVGGIVANTRHGPHAGHGQDLLIIQASHVGYDPQTREFGTYRRLQTADQKCGPSCGKVRQVLDWYCNEYQFAQQNIQLQKKDGIYRVVIDNQLLNEDRTEGLLLDLDRIIAKDAEGHRVPLQICSTAKMFLAADSLVAHIGADAFAEGKPQPIGDRLDAHLFYFQRNIKITEEGVHDLEHNLIRYMPSIVTSQWPILTAALINTQIEFDNTFRTIVKENAYHGKRLLFIAGLNIDVSPEPGQLFPLTKFVPWAAYVQSPDGSYHTYEQDELVRILEQQSTDNPDQIDLESAIQMMAEADEIKVEV